MSGNNAWTHTTIAVMTYKPHRRILDKDRVLAGYKAALNNPATSSEARSYARKQLLRRGHVKDALFSTSIDTRMRRMLGLRAKRR